MLRNFDDIDMAPGVTVRVEAKTVVQQKPIEKASYVGKHEDEWTPTDLRNYVVAEIERRFGVWDRNYYTEMAIFKRFHKEWGVKGVRMARFLFDSLDGWWQGDAVTVNRFCRGSDKFFAIPLSERLVR